MWGTPSKQSRGIDPPVSNRRKKKTTTFFSYQSLLADSLLLLLPTTNPSPVYHGAQAGLYFNALGTVNYRILVEACGCW